MAKNSGHWDETKALGLMVQCQRQGGALTSALRALVDTFGYVDDAAIGPLMHTYARSRAEVLGVISYYEDFRTSPHGRHTIRLCQAEACQAVGARTTTAHACKKTGLALGETSNDGQLTLEGVYCLGLCANGPAALIDGKPAAHLDAAAFDARLAEMSE